MNKDLLESILIKVSKIPQVQLSRAVFWLGVIISLSLAAKISWKLISPQEESFLPWQPLSTVSSQQTSFTGIEQLQDLFLFGQVQQAQASKIKAKPVSDKVTDAPKTSLSILLRGVVASTEDQHGLAVIESNGSQNTYGLGEKIKGTSAELKEVYADRIIITNNGRYETLMLDGLKYERNGQANSRLQQAKLKRSDNTRVSAISPNELGYARELLLDDPQKINDFFSISPVKRDGRLAGYRLNPGKDPRLFEAAGFMPNDLAKTINGYDLTDMQQSVEIMSQLPHLISISVMVQRRGQTLEILFNLPQH